MTSVSGETRGMWKAAKRYLVYRPSILNNNNNNNNFISIKCRTIWDVKKTYHTNKEVGRSHLCDKEYNRKKGVPKS